MTELNRNTRTLIVSFAVAIMALVPLRFMEVANSMSPYQNAAVLGESVRSEIVLPNAELRKTQGFLLEAPYNDIEKQGKEVSVKKAVVEEEAVDSCISSSDADLEMNKLTEKFLDGNQSAGETQKLLLQMEELEALRCR